MNISKNSQILFWTLIVLLTFVGGILTWSRLRPSRTVTSADALVVPSNIRPDVSVSPPKSQTDITRFQKPGGVYESTDPRWEIVRTKDKTDRNWEWRMPVNFYGRVVDENDRPIAGAKVDFSLTDLSAEGSSQSSTLTDSGGDFSLTGKTGRVLQVDVSKDGYYKPKSERLKSFDYAGFWEANYHQADRAAPVLFHLRKKGQGESLSVGETRPMVPSDGTPVRLDLFAGGRISNSGQVEVAAVTNTDKYPPRVFDWQASVAIQDGGLVEHNLEFPFEAPKEGYVPKAEFKISAIGPDWKRSIEKSYFIRIGMPPKYGRIRIRFSGASQKVSLQYAVNPTGSRNLEPNTEEP